MISAGLDDPGISTVAGALNLGAERLSTHPVMATEPVSAFSPGARARPYVLDGHPSPRHLLRPASTWSPRRSAICAISRSARSKSWPPPT